MVMSNYIGQWARMHRLCACQTRGLGTRLDVRLPGVWHERWTYGQQVQTIGT